MNKYINLYTENPTAGKADGTYMSKLSVLLDASKNESKVVTCAIRCMDGYQTVEDTTISFAGTTKAKWSICATQDGTFTDTLTLKDVIKQQNILFYVKAESSNDETPSNDTTVSIKVSTKVGVIV